MNDDAGRNYSEELLRALISTLSDIAFVIDEHGRYVEIIAQPQKDGLLAADLSVLKGKLLHDVFPREKADLFLSIVQKTIETQQNQNIEYLLPVQEGERWFEGRTALLHLPGQDKMMIWVSRDITERRMAYEQIRSSAARLAEAQRLAHVGNWEWDIPGETVWWSDEVYRIIGFTPGEVTATFQEFLKSVHPDDRKYVQDKIEKALAEENSYNIEHRIVRVDGTVRIVHEEGEVIRDAARKPVKMIGTMQDITDRKQAETALRTNARLLSESQRLGHVGSFLFDKHGVISWSDEMYRIYGVSPDTFKPSLESFMGLIHPDDRAAVQTWNASCAAGEEHGSLDFRINRPDGTVRFIRGNGDAVYDDQGALAFQAGMAQDVTRDKLAEETLRKKEEFSREVLNSMDFSVAVLDRDGSIIAVNAEWARFARENGGSVDKTGIGVNYLEICRNEAPAALHGLQSVLNGALDRFELEYPCDSPEEKRWFIMRATPIGKQRDGIIVAHVNITEHKRIEEMLEKNAQVLEARVQERTAELEEKTMRAEVASRAKTDFLSNMSHELRTPLNSIIGFSEVLKGGDAGTLTADQREFLENIWTSGKHLSRIIDDMLAFAEEGSNEPRQMAGEFDIKQLLEEVISWHAAGAAQQKIKVGTAIADEIGHVVAVREKIVQVVDHLLGNAFKFTPAGGIVQVSARRTGDKTGDMKLEIAVTDSGIGIAKEDLAQLFRPFEQLAAPLTKRFEGIGLGLAICKKHVEFHGGRIWCESEPGKGSTFFFTLPVTP